MMSNLPTKAFVQATKAANKLDRVRQSLTKTFGGDSPGSPVREEGVVKMLEDLLDAEEAISEAIKTVQRLPR